MSLVKIESYSRYQEIVGMYGQRDCLSNDYLQNDAADLISTGHLYEVCGSKNAFLLVKKNGFWRLYYYLNDLQERLILIDEVMTTEILFRRALGEPADQISYLEGCGFQRHLVRDQYSAMYKDMMPAVDNEQIVIRPADTLQEIQCAFNLFNNSFDKFTGDYIPSEEYYDLLTTGSVLMAWDQESKATFLGALHQTVNSNVAWVSHLAVVKESRGKHIGKALLDTFVEINKRNEKTRYCLWVQHQNEVAVALYSQKGFKHNGKSSLSMIKK